VKAIQANYKGKGHLFDKLIRIWKRSQYSHTELIIDGTWYSSSPRDGGARTKVFKPNPEHWDFVEVDINKAYALYVFSQYKGQGYDWLWIWFSQILPLNIHSKHKVGCSELVAAMRCLPDPHKFDPKNIATHKIIKPATSGFFNV